MSIGRCRNCGAEYFSGASDCPRCNQLIESQPVRYVEGGPSSAHYLGAMFAAVFVLLGVHNLYRAFNGLSVYIWRDRRLRRLWVFEAGDDWYWFVVAIWVVLIVVACHFTIRHFRIGHRMDALDSKPHV